MYIYKYKYIYIYIYTSITFDWYKNYAQVLGKFELMSFGTRDHTMRSHEVDEPLIVVLCFLR